MHGKYLAIIAVILLVFISGCVDLVGEGDLARFMGIGEPEDIAVEEVSVSVDPVLYTVDSGRDNTIFFDVENKGNMTLEDVEFTIFDLPYFSSDEEKTYWDLGDMEPGRTESWEWGFTADEVDSERTSNIRYRLNYGSEAYAEHSVTVLSYDEYLTRQEEGVLDVDLRYGKKDTSVDVVLGFSEEQPFVDEDEILLTMFFKDVGDGFVEGDNLDEGDVTLSYPDEFLNLQGDCQGVMDGGGGELDLDEDLYFYQGETSEVSCRFEVETDEDIAEGMFEIEAEYTYILDDSLTLTVEA